MSFKRAIYCLIQFFQLSLFRSSPEHLPSHWNCTLLAAAAYVFLGLLLSLLDHSTAVLQVFIDMAILALLTAVGLRMTNKMPRLPQTLSALFGINIVVTLVSWPLLRHLQVWLDPDLSGSKQLMLIIGVALLVWNLAAVSLVFRRAMEIGTLMAAVVSLNYLVLFEWLSLLVSSAS